MNSIYLRGAPWAKPLLALALSLVVLFAASGWRAPQAAAQEVAAVEQVVSEQQVVEQKATEPAAVPFPAYQTDDFLEGPESSAHNGWMLVCCALVLFMTAPGLALFYGGLVRKKNVLSVLMHCIFLMGLMTVLWGLYGYSLAFGGSHPYIGDFRYLCMHDVGRSWNVAAGAPQTPMYNAVLPRLTHMLFQGMFFIITPALICGAFAERMKFSAMVLFSILWGTLVYCPLAHWVWGGASWPLESRIPGVEGRSTLRVGRWCISVLESRRWWLQS